MSVRRIVFPISSVVALVFTMNVALEAQQKATPHAKVILLDSAGRDETPILTGPPETVTMRSGLIALEPGKSVGAHTTGRHEELLVVLEGRGTMTFGDGSTLPVEAGHAVYCSPETKHNVTNTGQALLRYVYVVASVPEDTTIQP